MPQSKELVAASATPMILSVLSHGESYGYAIIQRVKELSGNKIEWSDGMLYPVLRRLEKQGLIESEWRVIESGKKRRYYQIKNSGKKMLDEHRAQWQLTNRVLNKLWMGVPCST
ncbi:MAG: PadR family transcriptional regulator [Rubripirellula sp.]